MDCGICPCDRRREVRLAAYGLCLAPNPGDARLWSDGHTDDAVGAAALSAETCENYLTGNRVVLDLQPARGSAGGARRMMPRGCFERFPCDKSYGMHNDSPIRKPKCCVRHAGPCDGGAKLFRHHESGHWQPRRRPRTESKTRSSIGSALVQDSCKASPSRKYHPEPSPSFCR